VPVPSSPAGLLEGLATILRARPPGEEVLLAVTGASNVTGEVWPLAAIASLAHNYGARVFVDAAQLAPHRPVDIAGLGLDWVAFSGHKLYAPFGCGALIGRRDWLQAADPYLLGGGAVAEVTESGSVWASGPSRHEGGSPNLLGALAIAAACRALSALGRDRAASHDRLQSERLQAVLDGVPGVDTYAIWPENEDRLPVRTFQVRGYRPAEVAAVLSAEHGIGVRYGSFCAHPLLAHLERSQPAASGCSGAVPGAVRASLGLTSAVEELDRLSTALRQLVREGPRGKYRTLPDGSVEPAWGDRPYADFFSSARSGPSALQHLHTRL
jgi:selenocysteine lyase/cysteine desulfurase